MTITVDAPTAATAHVTTAQGAFDIRLPDLQGARALSFRDGDVIVQQTPTPQPVSRAADGQNDYASLAVARNGAAWVAWQAYKDLGDHVYLSHSTPNGWSEPDRVTESKGDIFQTAAGEDAQGRIWVVWSARTNEDWDLYARSYDGRQWGAISKVTSADRPNIFHRLVSDRSGALHLVWTGYRNGQSHVLWSKQQGTVWSSPVEISGGAGGSPAQDRASAWMRPLLRPPTSRPRKAHSTFDCAICRVRARCPSATTM